MDGMAWTAWAIRIFASLLFGIMSAATSAALFVHRNCSPLAALAHVCALAMRRANGSPLRSCVELPG